MKEVRVIKQDGQHTCLVCGNKFEWGIELIRLDETDLEKNLGTVPTLPKSKPAGCLQFSTVGNDEIQILIACPKCSYTHRLDRMKMIEE